HTPQYRKMLSCALICGRGEGLNADGPGCAEGGNRRGSSGVDRDCHGASTSLSASQGLALVLSDRALCPLVAPLPLFLRNLLHPTPRRGATHTRNPLRTAGILRQQALQPCLHASHGAMGGGVRESHAHRLFARTTGRRDLPAVGRWWQQTGADSPVSRTR